MAHFHYLILIIVIDERLVLVIVEEGQGMLGFK